jgi:hypothetical protein
MKIIVLIFTIFLISKTPSFSQDIVWSDSSKILLLTYQSNESEDEIFIAYYIDSTKEVKSLKFTKVYVGKSLKDKSSLSYEVFLKNISRFKNTLACIVIKDENNFLITSTNFILEDKTNEMKTIKIDFIQAFEHLNFRKTLYLYYETYEFESYHFL